MPRNLWIYPYSSASMGAKLLRDQLGIKLIRRQRSQFAGGYRHLVINWGNSEVTPEVARCHVLNQPHAVHNAANKLRAFHKLGPLACEWTASPAVARGWYDAGNLVVGRAMVSASEGRGIKLMTSKALKRQPITPFDDTLPLYTKYVAKAIEYRVHVFNGKVIDYTKKGLKQGMEPSYIRNTANGYVFMRNNIGPLPDAVAKACIESCRRLGLDFGAVDVVICNQTNKPYVLEVNTAPGIEGTTVVAYATAIKEYNNVL